MSGPELSRESYTDPVSVGSRFVDCEKWRADTKLDETVPIWEYPEKGQIFKYYPQYYHKTDKVGCQPGGFPPPTPRHRGY